MSSSLSRTASDASGDNRNGKRSSHSSPPLVRSATMDTGESGGSARAPAPGSPPARTARTADFSSALMRSISVECPAAEATTSTTGRGSAKRRRQSAPQSGGSVEYKKEEEEIEEVEERDSDDTDVISGDDMEAGDATKKALAAARNRAAVFAKLGKMPTEKIFNDRYAMGTF